MKISPFQSFLVAIRSSSLLDLPYPLQARSFIPTTVPTALTTSRRHLLPGWVSGTTTTTSSSSGSSRSSHTTTTCLSMSACSLVEPLGQPPSWQALLLRAGGGLAVRGGEVSDLATGAYEWCVNCTSVRPSVSFCFVLLFCCMTRQECLGRQSCWTWFINMGISVSVVHSRFFASLLVLCVSSSAFSYVHDTVGNPSAVREP